MCPVQRRNIVNCIAVTVHLNLIGAFDQESVVVLALSRESLLYDNNNVLLSNLFTISLQVQ